MSGFILRIIAMITMVIDHVGWNFLDNPLYFTWIGRIAFYWYLRAAKKNNQYEWKWLRRFGTLLGIFVYLFLG